MELEEKKLVLVKEHLAHDSNDFDHVDKADDIEVSLQLVLALPQQVLAPLRLRLALLQAGSFAARDASEHGQEHVSHRVLELALVYYEVVDRVQVVPCWARPLEQEPLQRLDLFHEV